MDEDIKIVEDYLLGKKMQYGEKYYKNNNNFKAIENLLIRLKTAERMNDVYIEEIRVRSIFYNAHNSSFSCCDLSKEKDGDCSKYGNKDNCNECIKEWARKKVEDDSSSSDEN